MPTNKPKIQAVIDEENYKKFLEICKKEDRTTSKLASKVIIDYIQQYEKENGKINTKELSTLKTG